MLRREESERRFIWTGVKLTPELDYALWNLVNAESDEELLEIAREIRDMILAQYEEEGGEESD